MAHAGVGSSRVIKPFSVDLGKSVCPSVTILCHLSTDLVASFPFLTEEEMTYLRQGTSVLLSTKEYPVPWISFVFPAFSLGWSCKLELSKQGFKGAWACAAGPEVV
jgi:hypothetical protein